MSSFIPGKIVKTFQTKNGHEVVIRYPKWEDLDSMISFINNLSEEDIYITFSGEVISKEGEMYYLAEVFKGIERRDSIYLACYIGDRFVGNCTVSRDLLSRKRSSHVGIFGITIIKEFRGEGIGLEIAKTTIEEAKKWIQGLRMLILTVYSENTIAQDLYRKLGFKEGGRIPQAVWYRDRYIDEIRMYKSLEDTI